MKIYSKICLIGLALALATLITQTLLAIPSTRAAGPWYVAPGGSDSNSCTSPGAACASINGALSKPGFVAGDTVLVATGTYIGSGNEVVLLNKSATLSGGWSAAFTTQNGISTIDGQGARRGVTVNSGVTATVERFVVQNGATDFGGGIRNSGTLSVTDSTVKSNVVSGDTFSSGGGIQNESGGTLTLSGLSDNLCE